MVRLNRIYTKTGDDGTTGLGDGTRLPKHHLRIAAYGTADELAAVLGLALAHGAAEPLAGLLRAVQNDLFDVGADLCVPGAAGDKLRITPVYTKRLEGLIDGMNAGLKPLSSFVLAGGRPLAAWLHLARTVCRRAERLVTELAADPDEAGRVNPEVVRYLNRLSDLLFVAARTANDGGAADVLWQPGGGGAASGGAPAQGKGGAQPTSDA
jgi:cob(I)alamin adenosyltransferase